MAVCEAASTPEDGLKWSSYFMDNDPSVILGDSDDGKRDDDLKVDTIFNTPEDFNVWNDSFEDHAIRLKLWDYIKTTADRLPWPTKPVKPELTDYARDKSRGEINSFSDLNEEETEAYMRAFTRYARATNDYRIHRASYVTLFNWMTNTIRTHYRYTLFEPKDTIDVRYAKIFELYKSWGFFLYCKIRAEYEDFISRPVIRVTRDMNDWITKWESIVARGIRFGMSEFKSSLYLIRDLQRPLGHILGSWLTGLRVKSWDKEDYLTVSELAEKLRFFVDWELPHLERMGEETRNETSSHRFQSRRAKKRRAKGRRRHQRQANE